MNTTLINATLNRFPFFSFDWHLFIYTYVRIFLYIRILYIILIRFLYMPVLRKIVCISSRIITSLNNSNLLEKDVTFLTKNLNEQFSRNTFQK